MGGFGGGLTRGSERGEGVQDGPTVGKPAQSLGDDPTADYHCHYLWKSVSMIPAQVCPEGNSANLSPNDDVMVTIHNKVSSIPYALQHQ